MPILKYFVDKIEGEENNKSFISYHPEKGKEKERRKKKKCIVKMIRHYLMKMYLLQCNNHFINFDRKYHHLFVLIKESFIYYD